MLVGQLTTGPAVVSLLSGFGCMGVAIHFWTEWETQLLDAAGVVAATGLAGSAALQLAAATAYWLGFVLMVLGAHALAGRSGAFLVWGLVGVVFELVQFVVVKLKTDGWALTSREAGLLALGCGLLFALGWVIDALWRGR